MRARGQLIGETERLAGTALAAGRIAIGVGIWTAPGLTARALGMKPFQGEALALARLRPRAT